MEWHEFGRAYVRRAFGIVLVALTAAIAGMSPTLGQTTTNKNDNNRPLADCLKAADQKYANTWKALCEQSGEVGHCNKFVGSPRDKEFSQLRIDEMTLCSKLYGR